MKRFTPILIILLLLIGANAAPVHAGEPTGEIGPMDPSMFRCIDKDDGSFLLEKQLIETLSIDSVVISQERIANTCTNDVDFDYGFDPTDAAQFKAYLREFERDCDELGGRVIRITETRIEGFVYEFHPRDPENAETTEWIGVPSKDVLVTAKGINFEIFWGSDDNGAYFFRDLGAGPILLNLQLPPDAHMLNPNVYIDSNGLDEVQKADLAFYRGDFEPPDPTLLITPEGAALSVLSLDNIEDLSRCGYTDLPAVVESYEPPPSEEGADAPAMPDVGGVLPANRPTAIIALAAIMLVMLPLAGLWQIRRH